AARSCPCRAVNAAHGYGTVGSSVRLVSASSVGSAPSHTVTSAVPGTPCPSASHSGSALCQAKNAASRLSPTTTGRARAGRRVGRRRGVGGAGSSAGGTGGTGAAEGGGAGDGAGGDEGSEGAVE